MVNYDVAIAYRIYPKVAKPAMGLPFSDDKLLLSEVCVQSLKKSLGGLRAKIWVLLDGCPDEYAKIFQKHFDAKDLVLIPLPGVGNKATFGKQIDILLEQTDSDLVYFAEDDYFYLPDQFSKMTRFLRGNDDADFVTPFDHLDYYTLAFHQHPKQVKVHSGHHWTTVASTCLTFLAKKESLRRHERMFRSYCGRNWDSSLWLSLTKYSAFNPIRALRFARAQKVFAPVYAKTWFFGWAQLLFGKRARLWVSTPAIATHLDKNSLAPNIDWIAEMRRAGELLRAAGPGA